MKKLVRSLLPDIIYRQFRLTRRMPHILSGYLHDLRRYVRHSSVVHYDDSEDKLRALITAEYHMIEKGLSLPEPRHGFGKEVLARLVGHIDDCLRRYGPRDYLSIPISAIGAYLAFHEKHNCELTKLNANYERLLMLNASAAACCEPGGVRVMRREEIISAIDSVKSSFFENRYSCRQYSDEPVTAEQIEAAVRVAQKSPCVCNRQSGRVYVFTEAEDIQKVLALEGGARGFSSVVKVLFCVAVDMRNFNGVGERYQCWIDGSMFAMSLVYGLHMQGIGSCCLNWSKASQLDLAMHALIGIPDHENIIMFIAAGHLPEEFAVAKSVRKSLTEVLEYKTHV